MQTRIRIRESSESSLDVDSLAKPEVNSKLSIRRLSQQYKDGDAIIALSLRNGDQPFPPHWIETTIPSSSKERASAMFIISDDLTAITRPTTKCVLKNTVLR